MGPLEGIRVLDLTTMVSGPVAAMMLADQGAEVIKIEPSHGEQMRHIGSPHNGVTAMFYCCNRGKKSLALDLKHDAGKKVLWRLIETADVFLQNFRATLIPLLTVPVSLIGALVAFPVLGFSINTLSLLGLVLAIGTVVDDELGDDERAGDDRDAACCCSVRRR